MARLQTTVIVRSVVHGDSTARKSALEHHLHPEVGKNLPVIPQRTRPRRPPKPHLNINITLINLIQILQNHIALRLVKPHDPLGHRAVDEQALPAGDGVHADQRVAALDVLGACVGVVAVEVGVRGAVDGVAAVDDLAELGREFLVGGVAGGPEGVAADGWDGVVVQVGYACWLVFMDACFVSTIDRLWQNFRDLQISVPPLRANRLTETRSKIILHQIRPNHRRALQARHMRHLRVDLNLTKILPQLKLLLRTQILITEEHDAALGDQQRELVSLLVGQVFELQADDLGADVRGQVLDFCGGGEEGGFVLVGARAGVDVFSVLVADGVDVLEEEGDGGAVLW
jgi:hypothetical protein